MCDRVNLRKYYVNQYGLEFANKIRRVEWLLTKRARLLAALNFLKRCRDNNIIPKCVRISPKKDIFGSANILHQASQKLLTSLIRQHRCDAHKINNNIESLSRELQNKLTKSDFEHSFSVNNNRATAKFKEYTLRQINKYKKLEDEKFGIPCTKNETSNSKSNVTVIDPVINLSTKSLDEHTVNVLKKGLNYALAPRKIPYEEIVCSVEDCLLKNNVKKEDLEAIRQDVSSVLRRSKPPKPNLSRDEYLALKNVSNDSELTILRADKGNATVVMDTSDYNSKIQELLSDQSTYKKVNKDPTAKILKKTTDLIVKYSDTLELDVKLLIPSCAKPPKLYGLPKVHKQNVPLRPIVSQIDTPTYKLAQHLAKILSQLRGNTNTFTRDSYHFVSHIKDLTLADDEVMVSFDVQSLFTNLPVKDCLDVVKERLSDHDMPLAYAELLEHCLTSGYLLWDNQFYLQVDGVAMGSPVSPVVADIFMEDFERRALGTAPVVPKIFKRYVDDTFTILPHSSVSAFLEHLNSIHSKIQFTMELEENKSLAFLDIKLIHNPDNSISHTVYRKPTHTDRYLNGDSHHHPSQLATVAKSLLQRANGICDADHLPGEIRHVKQVLKQNNLKAPHPRRRNRPKPITVDRRPAVLPFIKGVTDRIGHILKRASIKTYFKPHRKISQLLRPVKCHIPLQAAGVYKIDCDCGLSYIGQTKRSISTRIKEHIADVKHRRSGRSAVCDHALDGPNHYLRFDKPQILARENRYIPRMIREAIEIKKHPNFNREDGWNLPPVWNPVLQIIRSQTSRHHTQKQQDTVSDYCVQRNVTKS